MIATQYLHAEPIKNRSDSEMFHAHAYLEELSTEHGLKPTLIILDNEASKALKYKMTKAGHPTPACTTAHLPPKCS
jgi:hypothetical protein